MTISSVSAPKENPCKLFIQPKTGSIWLKADGPRFVLILKGTGERIFIIGSVLTPDVFKDYEPFYGSVYITQD